MKETIFIPEKELIEIMGDYYKGCCDTCHEDYEMGYANLIEIYLNEDLNINTSYDFVVEVCCWVYNAYEKWLKEKSEEAKQKIINLIEKHKPKGGLK